MAEGMGNIVFVVGTDTGVGKTVVSALLTRELCRRGMDVRPLKPFSSGGREDAELLRDAAADRWSLDEINPFAFKAPLTPLLAAEAEGRDVSLDECVSVIRKAGHGCDFLVVEGAGGVMSPLGIGYDARSLIKAFEARSILVAPNRLGVINQTLLALTALGSAKCKTPAVVMNHTSGVDESRASNQRLLERLRPEIGFEALAEIGASSRGSGTENFLQKTLATLLDRT